MRFKYLIATALFVSVVSYALVNNRDEQQAASPEFVHQEYLTNINTADMLTLQQLKGIGRKRAKAIITYREQHGNFASLDDLIQVPGISHQTVHKLQAQLTVG